MDKLRSGLDTSLRAAAFVVTSVVATNVAHAQAIRSTVAPVGVSRTIAVATPGPAAAAVPGTLTRSGEAPRGGVMYMSERWMLFRDTAGHVIQVPVLRMFDDGRPAQWVLESRGPSPDGWHRFDIPAWGTFDTQRPGSVERLLRSRPDPAIVFQRSRLAHDDATAMAQIVSLERSGFADTLFSIAGRPRAALGLLSSERRSAGDAAVYVTHADSIALDPLSARFHDDLRGMLAHELGHRLQRRRPDFFPRFWPHVKPIEDRHVYGHDNPGEHQAEAFRFAVMFLQVTADDDRETVADAELLEMYEALMPGARLTVLALLDEPIYRGHRMRPALLPTR